MEGYWQNQSTHDTWRKELATVNALFRLDFFLDLLNKMGRFSALAQLDGPFLGLLLLVKFENGDAFEVLAEDTPVELHTNFGGRFFFDFRFVVFLAAFFFLAVACFSAASASAAFALRLTTFRAIGASGGSWGMDGNRCPSKGTGRLPRTHEVCHGEEVDPPQR